MNILVLNPGGSSLKFALFAADGGKVKETLRGMMDHVGSAEAVFDIPGHDKIKAGAATQAQAAEQLIGLLTGSVPSDFEAVTIEAVGCRVVHGGGTFVEPVRVTPEVLRGIRELAPLAPLHNPVDAEVIEAVQKALPDAPVVAVFDTAFHRTLPPIASTYALPRDLQSPHTIRRYGFHGISHRYVSGKLLECLGREAEGTRMISLHAGNGASVCAIRDGQSVDISMGMTPLEGLVMGTRSGDLDPGIVLYLQREMKMSADAIDDLLNHKSGLLGLSGLSSDTRVLEPAAKDNEAVELALEIFAYRARKYIGAFAAVLGGCDALVITDGIGEHSAGIRRRICRGLEYMGIRLDDTRNSQATGGVTARVSTDDAPVQVWVIPTDEEGQMAQEAAALLQPGT